MAVTTARFAAMIISFALALSACEDFDATESGPTGEAAAQLGPDGARTEIRDVERADIFSATETGLWDGRPSLGGVWIAHPDVSDPERARITNTSNGQTVSGALFRRERANPGPRFQVSSDAAAALGMLAGQPAELRVVVVRQEEIELEPAPLPLSDETTTDEDPETADDSDSEAAVAAGVTAAAALEARQPQRQGFWSRFRDSLRNKPAGDVAMEADTAQIAETADTAAVPDVETQSLDPIVSTAAAAIAASDDAPTERRALSSIKNPYIQVGLFSMEDNASAAAATLRQAGIVPTMTEQSSNGTSLWRIFIGPVSNSEEQADILAQVKQLGYRDAFLAPN